MSRVKVRPAKGPLTGTVPVPSDKSIGHRALIFASIARGTSRITGFSRGEDNVATLEAFRAMGVTVEDDGKETIVVHGKGLAALREPAAALDCGNSGTTMRLLTGLLAAQPFSVTLTGDASLSRRPMGRVAVPLRSRGAHIEGRPHPTKAGDITAPLQVGPLPAGARLAALEYQVPVSSAQVKSALLFSGFLAEGPTVVYEPLLSRDHTERMLSALGVPIRAAGTVVSLSPLPSPTAIPEFDVDLPGDLSAAAFLLTAASIVPGSTVGTKRTGLNPTRAGIVDILRAFRGRVSAVTQGDVLGEPFGLVTAGHAELRAAAVGGELATRSIDEIPIACALAARAAGTTVFTDVGELRVKESDRIARMVALLRDFGVAAEEQGQDGFTVEGRPDAPLRAARVTSHGDHRIAMTAAVLGLVADGETIIDDADCIATSFPRFAGTLRALGADVEVEP
jgi:3-phosphoshikimate 1-carboxyvinyltransferase